RDWFLGDWHWGNSLPHDWTRVAVGHFVAGAKLNGINIPDGDNGRYVEVFIGDHLGGAGTFAPGSSAFNTVVHELGHSVLGDQLDMGLRGFPGITTDDKMHIVGD